ncbi:MAG: hypothetical protein AAGA56_20125 [Myxococcota bacterium]
MNQSSQPNRVLPILILVFAVAIAGLTNALGGGISADEGLLGLIPAGLLLLVMLFACARKAKRLAAIAGFAAAVIVAGGGAAAALRYADAAEGAAAEASRLRSAASAEYAKTRAEFGMAIPGGGMGAVYSGQADAKERDVSYQEAAKDLGWQVFGFGLALGLLAAGLGVARKPEMSEAAAAE